MKIRLFGLKSNCYHITEDDDNDDYKYFTNWITKIENDEVTKD